MDGWKWARGWTALLNSVAVVTRKRKDIEKFQSSYRLNHLDIVMERGEIYLLDLLYEGLLLGI